MPEFKKRLFFYQTLNGKRPFEEWFSGFKDKRTYALLAAKLDRLERYGHTGRYRSVQDGIYELKIDHGPGYRVYFAEQRSAAILLLVGGDKSTQHRDIEKAVEYWKDYKERVNET
ncbi:MAG: type II toxin-antitoxin system RelE/ParE family toxin [Candidatus Omnitrophica bacterium]|nr:type II toxin-antitoxin system RelE/ParE family toxin [Candidatus Omnitrophota bacterium]